MQLEPNDQPRSLAQRCPLQQTVPVRLRDPSRALTDKYPPSPSAGEAMEHTTERSSIAYVGHLFQCTESSGSHRRSTGALHSQSIALCVSASQRCSTAFSTPKLLLSVRIFLPAPCAVEIEIEIEIEIGPFLPLSDCLNLSRNPTKSD